MNSGNYEHGDVAMVLNGLLVWWEHRHDDDVLFLFFDDLKEDHAGCVRRIAKFTGIDCDEALLARVVHTTTHAEMVQHHSKFDSHNLVTPQYNNIIHRPEEALDIQSELIFVMAWCTYPRNKTLVHQQLSLHQLHHCHPSQVLPKCLCDVTRSLYYV